MKLVAIIAEGIYLQDKGDKSISFSNQDSNTRDFYFRIARDKLPQLLAGYLSNKSFIARVVRGSIKSFIVAHGSNLTNDNRESLTKRILSNIRHNHPQSEGRMEELDAQILACQGVIIDLKKSLIKLESEGITCIEALNELITCYFTSAYNDTKRTDEAWSKAKEILNILN